MVPTESDNFSRKGCVVNSTVRPEKQNPTQQERLDVSKILDENFGRDLGLMHEVIVTGKKVDFTRHNWASLAHDEYFFTRVRRLEHAYWVHLGWLPEEVREAVKILGPKNVLHHFDVMAVWAADLKHDRESFRFVSNWREVLENCATQNTTGQRHWVLAFHPGFSLNEQIIRTGYHSWSLLDGYNIGFSHGRYDLQSVEKDGIPPGYRLVDFTPWFGKMSFADRVNAVKKKMGADYSIVSASVVSAATLAANRLNGDTLLGDTHHSDGQTVVYVQWPEDSMQDVYLDYSGASTHHSSDTSLVERKFQIFEDDDPDVLAGGGMRLG